MRGPKKTPADTIKGMIKTFKIVAEFAAWDHPAKTLDAANAKLDAIWACATVAYEEAEAELGALS
jgi:hypothetical protein